MGSFVVLKYYPLATGDGKEYQMQVIAFENHLSFGITADDIEEAKEVFFLDASGLHEEYYVNRWNHLHEYQDAKYSNHYGMYSALVTPIKIIISMLGFYPTYAFFYTNLLLYATALFVIYFFLKIDSIKKLLLILLIMINPALFYMGWTHAEVYIFAFVVIGLVFYYNKEHGKAIFFLCVASMQNLGVVPFAMMVGVDLIVNKVVEYKKSRGNFDALGFLKKDGVGILLYGLCYLPGIIPIASTYIKFGKLNLVADVATENKYLLSKALDYLFDLNIGILPYEPIVLLLFVIMAVVGLKRHARASIINIVGVMGMLFIIAHQIQINSGMQFIMRYNVWIIPIMIFFVVCNWEYIFTSGRRLLVFGVAEVMITGFMCFYVIFGSGGYTNAEFAPWTKVVLDIMPSVYTPSHGIFYSRTLGYESYYSDEPAIYTNENGYVRKILLSKEAESKFYSDAWKLCDVNGVEIDKSTLVRHSIDEGDYSYINVTGEVYYNY